MKKYVALLRGINVGGNNRVEMAKLKKVFEALGFSDVSTYINSGNVIFSSKKKIDVEKIQKGISKVFGFNIPTLIRSQKEIVALNKFIPKKYMNDTEQRTDVLFLWEKYHNKSSLKLIKSKEVDVLTYFKGHIVWHLERVNYTKSGMNKFIGTEVYKNMTARNLNTVRKLLELMKK